MGVRFLKAEIYKAVVTCIGIGYRNMMFVTVILSVHPHRAS